VGDIPASCADISLAGKVLGYKPEITFAEGIKRTCRWYAGESHKI
jgi:nucleoside-diphosphate-sugar epimerase